MKDSEHYTRRSQLMLRLAHQAGDEIERQGYLSMATAYVALARDAAIFEARAGSSLTETAPGDPAGS